jgi:hypothetical protein
MQPSLRLIKEVKECALDPCGESATVEDLVLEVFRTSAVTSFQQE